jgi:hypothetical protein
VENHVYLSHGVQVAGVVWRATMRIMAVVGDLLQRIGDGCIGQVLGGQTIRSLGDAMCDLYRAREYEERRFLG